MSSVIEAGGTMITTPEQADWRDAPLGADALQRVNIAGRYQYARRFIDPPQLDLTLVEGAAQYELLVTPLDASSAISSLRAREPRIDLASAWSHLPLGRFQLVPRAWNDADRLIAIGPATTVTRSPDWDGRTSSPLNYEVGGLGVIEYLTRRAPAAAVHGNDPAYMWHADVSPGGDTLTHDFQFPALTYPTFMHLFIAGAGIKGDDGQPGELLTRACRLADFLIDHPAATEGPLAGVPLSTMDQQGKGGMYEVDRITLVRLGWTGVAMLALAEATGVRRYAAYAHHLGRILLDTQLQDGSWPYRVKISDGTVVEEYTAAAVMALLLLEHLDADDPERRYTDAFERGLAWTLANPVQTGLWQQMYEDVRTIAPYANLEQWAALETAMLLLRRDHSDGLPVARALIRYVEDQFVVFGDDPVFPAPYFPFTPATMEQYHCYWPMDFHTANYARAALALYTATGDRTWGEKAIAAANTVAQCRMPDGRLSTVVPDRRLGVTPSFSNWFNCMAHAANVLLTIGPDLIAIAREEG
jgi:hypothetical protein